MDLVLQEVRRGAVWDDDFRVDDINAAETEIEWSYVPCVSFLYE